MSNVSLLPSEILVSVLIDVKGLGVVVIESKVIWIVYVDIADGNNICRWINKFNDDERLHVFVGANDFCVLYIWDEFKSYRCHKHIVGERNLDSIFNCSIICVGEEGVFAEAVDFSEAVLFVNLDRVDGGFITA